MLKILCMSVLELQRYFLGNVCGVLCSDSITSVTIKLDLQLAFLHSAAWMTCGCILTPLAYSCVCTCGLKGHVSEGL